MTEAGPETERDGDRPLSAQEALALVEVQHERAARSLQVDVPVILALWGIAWLGGFGFLAAAVPYAWHRKRSPA